MVAKKRLSDQEIDDLRRRKVFDSKKHGKCVPTELHQPDALGGKLLKSDIPILALDGVNGVTSDLLKKLGVRGYPPLAEVDKWLATSDKTTYDLAIQCLKENGTKYNEEASGLDIAFIPAESGILARRDEVHLTNLSLLESVMY